MTAGQARRLAVDARTGRFSGRAAAVASRPRDLRAAAAADQRRSRAAWSRRTTSGSCSAPASASATSSIRAWRRPTSRRKPRSRRIEQAGLTPADIGLIVVGTTTPDMMFPSTACLLQDKIGATQRVGLRSRRCVLGFHLCADHRGAAGGQRCARPRAGRRRRRDVEHHRLHGSHHLRAVRRWRRRRRDVARRPTPSLGSVDFECEIDGSGGPALCMPAGGSLPARVDGDGRAAAALREAGRRGGVQVRRPQDGRDLHAGCWSATDSPDRTSTSSSRTRRTGGSSCRPPSGSASTKQGRHQHRPYGNTTAATIPLALERCRRGRPAEEGQSRAARLGRRRVHGRIGAAALGDLRTGSGSGFRVPGSRLGSGFHVRSGFRVRGFHVPGSEFVPVLFRNFVRAPK